MYVKIQYFCIMEPQLPPIDKQKVLDRLTDIKNAIKELERFTSITIEEFVANRDSFPLASYWLRLAIEGVLTIGTHILSRMPSNGKKKDYTQVLLSLGDYGVIPQEFAAKIKGMAGYRNRLVHLYWEVSAEEIYNLLKDNLSDLDKFNSCIKKFLQDY